MRFTFALALLSVLAIAAPDDSDYEKGTTPVEFKNIKSWKGPTLTVTTDATAAALASAGMVAWEIHGAGDAAELHTFETLAVEVTNGKTLPDTAQVITALCVPDSGYDAISCSMYEFQKEKITWKNWFKTKS